MKYILLLSFWLAGFVAMAQAPLSAEAILNEAYATARAENKKVFVMFHASWCGWCRRMDESMNDASVKKFFDDNFVIRHLVVLESKGKENLENPGALELMKKYNAEKQGLPFWLIYNKDGQLVADSRVRPEGAGWETGDNIACPATEKEVSNFIDVLKKTTSLRESELALITKRFRQNEPH